VVRPGLNYRIDEMRSALVLLHLAKLDVSNAERKSIVDAYRRELSGIAGISLPFAERDDRVSSSHIFPILLADGVDRLKVVERLKAEGIQSSIHYPAIHHFTAYADMGLGETPIADEVARRELTLPLYPDMTEADVSLVVAALGRALAGA
jgi:dTDP-4-amino-4,6-dideoxygalactose transaminase